MGLSATARSVSRGAGALSRALCRARLPQRGEATAATVAGVAGSAKVEGLRFSRGRPAAASAAEGFVDEQADRGRARLEGRALLFGPGVDGRELIGLDADQDRLAFPRSGAAAEVFDITT